MSSSMPGLHLHDSIEALKITLHKKVSLNFFFSPVFDLPVYVKPVDNTVDRSFAEILRTVSPTSKPPVNASCFA